MASGSKKSPISFTPSAMFATSTSALASASSDWLRGGSIRSVPSRMKPGTNQDPKGPDVAGVAPPSSPRSVYRAQRSTAATVIATFCVMTNIGPVFRIRYRLC
eukprot:711985-Pyramimonas_sp.AAC.2